ncbi:MAG: cbb3-type cytochrome oxidase assembly protein CcoS [Myxococcota bacterium]|nr:cbb3-type cytochrome oxidase assembly protein CcoS [Myxococcota bacterium]
MEVLILLVFVSLTLAGSAIGLFTWLIRQKTFEHDERLVLLPIDDGREQTSTAEEPGT